jgi:hypothetical protein
LWRLGRGEGLSEATPLKAFIAAVDAPGRREGLSEATPLKAFTAAVVALRGVGSLAVGLYRTFKYGGSPLVQPGFPKSLPEFSAACGAAFG